MITSIQFQNFKVLKDATLPLSRFTLIVGPNGSGKTTALNGLSQLAGSYNADINAIRSRGVPASADVAITAHIQLDNQPFEVRVHWPHEGSPEVSRDSVPHGSLTGFYGSKLVNIFANFRAFAFQASSLAAPVSLRPYMQLQRDGLQLALVLDSLRDSQPERFEALNKELGRWLPEFDRILFETPGEGLRGILLRTRAGGYAIRSYDLSEGTLLALAYLTLAYLPDPPALVAFEEPDRGIHPRLLRHIQDAMYRLSYPENYGEERPPVQVIAITHSPYLLDLYRDHPEEIVIAQKEGQYARFERLSDMPHIDDIVGGAPLGEVWYTGVLGGVPSGV